MPKNIPSMKPKELVRLLETGGCKYLREGNTREIINCISVIMRARKGWFQSIWEQGNYLQLMCFVFLGSLGFLMKK